MTTETKRFAVIAGIVLLIVVAGGAIAAGFLFNTQDYRAAYASLASGEKADGYTDQQHPQQLHMQLQGQFPGPLKDTLIQRWRDPVDGTVCYLYLPVAVPHAPGPSGLVQYGPNGIGSISCIPGSKRG